MITGPMSGRGVWNVGVYEAFDGYQNTIDADPAHVKLARERRDLFIGALQKADGVKEIVKSGSLERRTQLEPIHDVDLIMVFDGSTVPEWGSPGSSSNEALERAHDEVVARLGLSRGTDSKLVRRADARDHAVKCFVDPPTINIPSLSTSCRSYAKRTKHCSSRAPIPRSGQPQTRST